MFDNIHLLENLINFNSLHVWIINFLTLIPLYLSLSFRFFSFDCHVGWPKETDISIER